MNSHSDVDYRLKLAEGFLKEAEEDFSLKRWRSCVDNSQLAVENSGKAILMLFGVSPKTHEPAKHLKTIVTDESIPEDIRNMMKNILPDFFTLGLEEHFMTDYGDEASYNLPWDLFDEESASTALNSARICSSASREIIRKVLEWRSENSLSESDKQDE